MVQFFPYLLCVSASKSSVPGLVGRRGLGGEVLTGVGGSTGHARHFVEAAVLDTRLPGEAKAGEGFAALVRAPFEDDIHHPLQLVLAAEHATAGARHVAGGLLGALRVHAVLVTHIHHPLLDVILAVEAP